jgi:hypothetical protein
MLSEMGMAGVFRAARIVALTASLIACGKQKHVTLVLERADIEERLRAKFPIVKEKFLSTVTLDDPRLVLPEGSDRIGIDTRVRTKVPLLPEYTGRVAATGRLSYRREEKAFYLEDPTIDQLEIAGLMPEHVEKVRAPIESVARSVLGQFPVYEFRSRNLKEVTAEHVLRSVAVRNGRVHAELALPF